MEIIAACPFCHTQWALDEEAADRRVTCARCGRLFRVPPLQDLERATGVLRQAATPLFVDGNGRTYG